MKKYLIILIGILIGSAVAYAATARVLSFSYDDVTKKIVPHGVGSTLSIPTENASGVIEGGLTLGTDMAISESGGGPKYSVTDGTITSVLQASTGDVAGFVGTTSSHPLNIGTNNTARMSIDTSGNTSVTGSLTSNNPLLILAANANVSYTGSKNIQFGTVVHDSHSGWDADPVADSHYNIPETGYYEVVLQFQYLDGGTPPGTLYVQIVTGTATEHSQFRSNEVIANSYFGGQISCIRNFTAGTELKFIVYPTSSNITLVSSNGGTQATIRRIK